MGLEDFEKELAASKSKSKGKKREWRRTLADRIKHRTREAWGWGGLGDEADLGEVEEWPNYMG